MIEIARIDKLSAAARPSWFGLLGYLAFVGVTLLSVTDADFFIPSRQTQLPLLGLSIPTASFFMFGPILAAALYVYLHLHLTKLWDALGSARSTIGGPTVQALVLPWLVNDLALTYSGPNSTDRRPLTWLSNAVTSFLIWIAGPLLLVGFWWRSFPAHAQWTTVLIAVCTLISMHVGFASWRGFRASIRRETPRRRLATRVGGFLFATLLLLFGWSKTEGRLFGYVEVYATMFADELSDGPRRVFSVEYDMKGRRQPEVARADLAWVEFSVRPASWRSAETARARFRGEWCRAQGMPADACGPYRRIGVALPLGTQKRRTDWCATALPLEGADRTRSATGNTRACRDHFDGLEARFTRKWNEERRNTIAALHPIVMPRADLREANLFHAFMVGATITGAEFQDADLRFAQLEGAVAPNARFDRACLAGAVFEDASLQYADFTGTNLNDVIFDGAYADPVSFDGAFMDGTSIRGAYLRNVSFIGSYLDDVSLEGASLWGKMENAYLLNSRLQAASLASMTISFSELSEIEFDKNTILKGKYFSFKGNGLRNLDLSKLDANKVDWQKLFDGSFGDGSVILPLGKRPPAHWTKEVFVDKNPDDDKSGDGLREWRKQLEEWRQTLRDPRPVLDPAVERMLRSALVENNCRKWAGPESQRFVSDFNN